MNNVNNENGFTTTFFAIFMPLILVLLGLCTDGSIIVYQKISLETATDAASRSAIDAYDREIWMNDRKVVLDPSRAQEIVTEVLRKNNINARLINLEVPVERPAECEIKTEMEIPLFFLKIFGISYYTVQTNSVAHGYAEEEE